MITSTSTPQRIANNAQYAHALNGTSMPPKIERRSGVDRRQRSLRAYWWGSLYPRRLGGRRAEDKLYPFIDWHSPRVLAVTIAVLLCCVVDATLTLVLLSHGAVEINPFMALLLPQSPGWFVFAKLTLTAFAMIILVACSQMRLLRIIPGEFALYAVFLTYCSLVYYEFGLLNHLGID
jgi:hypothetical protein